MNIAIIDTDLIGRKSHRFPNLCSMKISGYHKEQGYNVELITDYKDLYLDSNTWNEYQDAILKYSKNQNNKTSELLREKMIPCFKKESFKYDKIFISKVFTDTEIDEDFLKLDFVEYGGTGFTYDKAPDIPYEIEHHIPDYHLYDDWVNLMIESGQNKKDFEYYLDYSIGYLTRHCFRGCFFCVNKNYKKVDFNTSVKEFLDTSRKYICLLDDNILGYSDWKSVIDELINTKKYFVFKQGMDIRLMTDEKAAILSKCKYRGDYIFAFDDIKDRDSIEKKLELWRKYCKKTTKLYVFCGFEDSVQDIISTFERIKILMKYGCLPYIMRHENYIKNKFFGTYINLARWCNQPNFFKKKSYREYCQANQDRTKVRECSAVRYLKELEELYPEIAKEYYDLKYEKLNKYSNTNKTRKKKIQ